MVICQYAVPDHPFSTDLGKVKFGSLLLSSCEHRAQLRGAVRIELHALNEELVREAWALKQARPRVTLQWIKAHDGSTWNEYADALAGLWQR